jgi:hypothetical protein
MKQAGAPPKRSVYAMSNGIPDGPVCTVGDTNPTPQSDGTDTQDSVKQFNDVVNNLTARKESQVCTIPPRLNPSGGCDPMTQSCMEGAPTAKSEAVHEQSLPASKHEASSTTGSTFTIQPFGSGLVTVNDTVRRMDYITTIEDASEKAAQAIRELATKPTAENLAEAERIAREVSSLRNVTRTATQETLSVGGQVMSEAIEQPRDWATLLEKYGKQHGGSSFKTFEEIALASGRYSKGIVVLGKVLGPAAVVVGGVLAYQRISSAPPNEKAQVVVDEIDKGAGGALGGTIGTAVGATLAVASRLSPLWGGLVGGAVGSAVGSKYGLHQWHPLYSILEPVVIASTRNHRHHHEPNLPGPLELDHFEPKLRAEIEAALAAVQRGDKGDALWKANKLKDQIENKADREAYFGQLERVLIEAEQKAQEKERARWKY